VRVKIVHLLKRAVLLLAVGAVAVLAMRAVQSQRGPALEPWHTYAPTELRADALAGLEWPEYLRAEASVFADVQARVVPQLEPQDRVLAKRYFAGSVVYPPGLSHDWNHSYVLEPAGDPVGAVVLLHGLTDSPYSLRHIARRYTELGWVAVAIRLPGHGTVPAGLADVDWEDWTAATRLAVREARRRVGPSRPLHLVGFSNGGALALQYALDALSDAALSRPDRLVLLSPMIGDTSMARFAGVLGWPALFPKFAKAAWLSIVPEFNPFKYNSFPINAARQSSLLTGVLQAELARAARERRLAALPPILTFQSVVDFTVSTRAIVTALYARLPANGSELVLFDLNRNAKLGPLLRVSAAALIDRVLPAAPRDFRTAILANAAPDSGAVVERVVETGATAEQTRDLGLTYPSDVFSLSHVAVPFPTSDGLYGMFPDPAEDYGVQLGTMAVRGVRATLIVSTELLTRMSSNPFFPYMLARIEDAIASPARGTRGTAASAPSR